MLKNSPETQKSKLKQVLEIGCNRRVGKELAFPPKEHGTPSLVKGGDAKRRRDLTTAAIPPSSPLSKGGKKTAFTLAEVLITLGIIGVVAAMTLPTVITKYQKKAAAVKLKKLFMNYENALVLTEAQEAVSRNQWRFSSTEERTAFTTEKILPNLNCMKVLETLGNSNVNRYSPICILKDGSMIAFHTKAAADVTRLELFFILDSKSLYENKLHFGRNAFYHTTYFNSNGNQITSTRTALLNGCKPVVDYTPDTPTTVDGPTRECLNLIRYDGWEIKDDYPW